MSEQGFSLTERDPLCQESQENRRRVVPVPFGSGDLPPVVLDAHACPLTRAQVTLIEEREAARRTLVIDPRPALAQAQARRFGAGR